MNCLCPPTVTPEPATLALMAIGLLLLAAIAYRRRALPLVLVAVMAMPSQLRASCVCPPVPSDGPNLAPLVLVPLVLIPGGTVGAAPPVATVPGLLPIPPALGPMTLVHLAEVKRAAMEVPIRPGGLVPPNTATAGPLLVLMALLMIAGGAWLWMTRPRRRVRR